MFKVDTKLPSSTILWFWICVYNKDANARLQILYMGRPCEVLVFWWVRVFSKWAWSGSREQFLHCRLRKFRHGKSSVYRWYTQFDRRRFVYDSWDNGSRLGRVMVECTLFMTHCLRLNLQLHTISLVVRTCRISSFCTVAWQLVRLLLTRRIARSLGDSWASCQRLS